MPVWGNEALSKARLTQAPSTTRIPPSKSHSHFRIREYSDGRVTRYGHGESYRPNPTRGRSPPPPSRDSYRARSPPRRGAPPSSDTYVPGRPPRARSPSVDRYRRRSRSPAYRSRDKDIDSYRSRARSPVRTRDDDRGYRRAPSPRAYDRDHDRDYERGRRGYSRDRSPVPVKRSRDASLDGRGIRSSIPAKRERLASPRRHEDTRMRDYR